MEDFEDLNRYNGDTEHDIWEDFDYNENTGDLADILDDTDLDQFIDNSNDWD